ncbi:MAG: hypothetical protein OXI87_11515 [Albidovulum sp.]|nr:hypothetical protein [Albidovulum sp.]
MKMSIFAGLIFLYSLSTSAFSQIGEYSKPTKLTALQIKTVQQGVKRGKRDPSSAIFGDFYGAALNPPNGDIAVCGAVNGKNQFGGYAGYQLFLGIMKGELFFASINPEYMQFEDCMKLGGYE